MAGVQSGKFRTVTAAATTMGVLRLLGALVPNEDCLSVTLSQGRSGSSSTYVITHLFDFSREEATPVTGESRR